jgi:hypothetical protein
MESVQYHPLLQVFAWQRTALGYLGNFCKTTSMPSSIAWSGSQASTLLPNWYVKSGSSRARLVTKSSWYQSAELIAPAGAVSPTTATRDLMRRSSWLRNHSCVDVARVTSVGAFALCLWDQESIVSNKSVTLSWLDVDQTWNQLLSKTKWCRHSI